MTMNTLNFILLSAGSFAFSILFTGSIRRYAVQHAVLDVPNARSLHHYPTPRGGGLSISISLMLSTIVLYTQHLLPLHLFIAFFVGGLVVTIVGWLDDRYQIAVARRALAYLFAAAWAVYWVDSQNLIQFNDEWYHYVIGGALSVLLIAWITNLYNFMDGTDGMAAVQAICTGGMAGLLLNHAGQPGLAILCFVIAASCGGFIFWNWSPAKIFMGDVGSCLLGFSFGAIAVMGASNSTMSLSVWFILLAVFVCDASLTLLMRLINGEEFYSAHRSHAYQRLVQMGCSHAVVAWGVLCINVVILWPTAYITYTHAQLSYMTVPAVTLFMCLLWGVIQMGFYRRSSG
jgi:Fuc2NAc and GlcNAc transferase